jgi:hypothetical protein
MMKKTLTALAVFAVALTAAAALATPASAKQTAAPLWTAQQAANVLFDDDIELDNGDVDTVTYVRCRGIGRRVGVRFRHFQCYVEVLQDDPYYVRLHTGWGGYNLDFIGYA